ncbi:Zn-ribbon domain-containing OB-fold protein [Rhodococcus opacus]|uniref:Zn-ribbon domain-containing OB-fold protein n=1 Tax=Rhodococcus opacus TaxID=37919 RepID=UPI002953F85E|nr:OB-fold domain-containing protein [Rhodococcus opacus]MDV7089126.1 OB-fold domain-containing protein [Rhodococcus opacus]
MTAWANGTPCTANLTVLGTAGEFLEAADRNVFLLKWSSATGEVLEPQASADRAGGTALEWRPAGGGGSVISWAVIPGRPPVETRRVIAIIELDEGPWWWGQVVGVDPAGDIDLRGARVRVEFRRLGQSAEDEYLPVFRLQPG